MVSSMTGRRPDRCSDNLGMTTRLADRLGLTPMLTKLKVVHVAGTKGKGTTSTFASKLIGEAYGKRVGLFTSPHLFDVRERIQVNNALIDKDKFTEYFFDVHDRMSVIAESSESVLDRESASRSNFFRFMFLLSLYAFERENVEVAVYEVGIGGRLDSTNIFPRPAACGITTLGMDHMELLGDTVEKIAYEKAGIIKPDVPCFSAPQRFHPSTRDVIMQEGRKVGAPVIFLDDDIINPRRWPTLRMGGSHFVENSRLGFALARTAVGIPVPQPIVRKEWDVIESTRLEGRSEMIRVVDPIERDPRRQRSGSLLMRAVELRQKEVAAAGGRPMSSVKPLIESNDLAFYLDGAHNPESMLVMSEWFFGVQPRGLIPIESRPATPTKNANTGGASSSLPPTPPPSPRTAAGVSKILPSHLVVSPCGSRKPNEVSVTQIRNTILFYCTRSPKDMLRYFMPYNHLIDKVIFCLIPNPKQTLTGDQRHAVEEDRLALAEWLEAWRNLYREVPCYAAPDAFGTMADCLEVIRTTPFRVRPDPCAVPTDAKSAAASITPSPYPANLDVDLKAIKATLVNEGPAAVHVEDRVLVTGSVLFVGDMLKMMHDVGLYPDN